MQSSRDDIYLMYTIKREYLNEIGFEALFESLIDDLNHLKENPIQLSNGYKIRVELEVSVADNSGNSQLFII